MSLSDQMNFRGKIISALRPGPRAILFLFPLLALVLSLSGFAGALAAAEEKVEIFHSWKRVYYGQLNGQEKLLFGGRIERAKPTLGDLDGDGDKDLLIGTAQGRVLYFENQGSAQNPSWRLTNENVTAEFNDSGSPTQKKPIDVGENATPDLVDIDGDGDLDLMVGSAQGRLYFFQNIGNKFLPILQLQNPNFLGTSFGKNLAIKFADINRDGLPDLALGNSKGEIFMLLNQGNRSSPRFCVQPDPVPPFCLVPPQKVGLLDPEDNAVPDWVDWDGDGDQDLMVGKSDGKIAFYRNLGNPTDGRWELYQQRFEILDAGGYAAPLFEDFNEDGIPDLLLAGDGEKLVMYSGKAVGDQPRLWLEDDNVLQVARLGGFQSRLHMASGDLDGDGDSELIIGTRGGKLLLYVNEGAKGEVALLSSREPILYTPQRSYSAPALVDLDNDKDLDLVVGDRNGRLELIENIGSPKKARWKLIDLNMGGIDVGSFSIPAFFDLDGNGLQDMVVGNSLGKVLLYGNRGNPKRAKFIFQSLNFGGFRIRNDSVPTFFTYDPKRPPDLVVGSSSGRLLSATRNPAVPSSQRNSFTAQQFPWAGIMVEANSSPHFVDLTGDGRQDLLLGGADGLLAMWRYEGTNPKPSSSLPPRLAGNVLPGAGNNIGGIQGEGFNLAENKLIQLDPIFTLEKSGVSDLKPGRNTRPAFFDANGNGLSDLVVGTSEGKLLLFFNLGPKENPRWKKAAKNFAGYKQGRYAAPAFYDLDGDGDQDLIVGNEDGRLNYWENTGSSKRPVFKHLPGAFKIVRAGKNAVPFFSDLDGDGKADLLVGNLRGQILFYKRQSGQGLKFKLITRNFLELDVGVNSSPIIAPLIGGKTPVLLVGSDRGNITVLLAIKSDWLKSSAWKINKIFLEGLKIPLGSHPALADLDQDGDLDLFVGNEAGSITFYRNNALVPELTRMQ